MTYFLPLTPERAATTFAGVPCTDRSHFDLPQTVHPGDWEYETSRVLRGANGHHRCKFPKRAIAVKESSGDFAIVHVKKGNQHGHRFMKPTKEMLVYFKEAGVMLEFTRQIEKMAMRARAETVGTKGMIHQEDLDWEVVDEEEDGEEFVWVDTVELLAN